MREIRNNLAATWNWKVMQKYPHHTTHHCDPPDSSITLESVQTPRSHCLNHTCLHSSPILNQGLCNKNNRTLRIGLVLFDLLPGIETIVDGQKRQSYLSNGMIIDQQLKCMHSHTNVILPTSISFFRGSWWAKLARYWRQNSMLCGDSTYRIMTNMSNNVASPKKPELS